MIPLLISKNLNKTLQLAEKLEDSVLNINQLLERGLKFQRDLQNICAQIGRDR